MSSRQRWLRWLLPLGAYLLVAVSHTVNDLFGGALSVFGTGGAMVLFAALNGIPFAQLNAMTPEQFTTMVGNPQLLQALFLLSGSTFIMLVNNVFIIPLLLWATWRSGDDERRIVRERLKDEPEVIITPEEYSGVQAERRLRLRAIPGYPKRVAKALRQLQNELAFWKDYLLRHGGDLASDPPSQAISEEITGLRARS